MPRKSRLVILRDFQKHAPVILATGEFHAVFNYGEAGLWFVIACVLMLRRHSVKPWRWLLPCTFALFGVSDLIEAKTGAWWEPWWLLVMKAACVWVFLLAWRAYRRQRKPHG